MTTPDPLNILWTEKYRPTDLGALALEEETRVLLQSYLDAGEIPHILMSGPPGSGKTTVARILIDHLDCTHRTFNASADRGIDVVRQQIGMFASGLAAGVRWRIVFLDEADAMTSDAQTALRNMMEANAENTRFVLTCNYPHRIIGAIQSRCQALTLGRPPIKERFRILKHVLEAEEVEADPQVVFGYAERFPDMRSMLMAAQRASLSGKAEGGLPPTVAAGKIGGLEILNYIETQNWTALRRLTASGDFDPQQGLRDLFWAISDGHKKVGFLRHVIAKGLHESAFTPDPVVLFLGTAAECMEGL